MVFSHSVRRATYGTSQARDRSSLWPHSKTTLLIRTELGSDYFKIEAGLAT